MNYTVGRSLISREDDVRVQSAKARAIESFLRTAVSTSCTLVNPLSQG